MQPVRAKNRKRRDWYIIHDHRRKVTERARVLAGLAGLGTSDDYLLLLQVPDAAPRAKLAVAWRAEARRLRAKGER